MTEQELRRLVREAVRRQPADNARHGGVPGGGFAQPVAAAVPPHVSHGMFTLSAGADADGPCIIEPAVMCNHCGYCKSYGY